MGPITRGGSGGYTSLKHSIRTTVQKYPGTLEMPKSEMKLETAVMFILE